MKVIGLYGAIGWDLSEGWIHGGGASLWIDGEHCCSITEERLTRIKFDGSEPMESIKYVLNEGDLSRSDIDIVAYSGCAHSFRLKAAISRRLTRLFPNAKVVGIDHHRAHACAAFYSSPFEKASVLSYDGAGSTFPTALKGGLVMDDDGYGPAYLYETGLYALGDKSTGKMSTIFHAKQGLNLGVFSLNAGQVYNTYSCYIYRRMCSDVADKIMAENPYLLMEIAPGKVMGLAGYGDHTKVDQPSPFHVTDDVFYFPEILSVVEDMDVLNPYSPRDIAAWLQYSFEEGICEWLETIPGSLKEDNLCIAGGCGLNVIVNRKIIDRGIFKDLYLFPAANDHGLPFGAACAVMADEGIDVTPPENVAFLGKLYTNKDVEEAIEYLL